MTQLVPSRPWALTKVEVKAKVKNMVGPREHKEESQQVDPLRRRQDEASLG